MMLMITMMMMTVCRDWLYRLASGVVCITFPNFSRQADLLMGIIMMMMIIVVRTIMMMIRLALPAGQ